jgi:hypothetical protein
MSAADVIRDFEKALDRRLRTVTGVCVGSAAIVVGGMLFLYLASGQTLPISFLLLGIAVDPVLLAGFFFVLRRRLGRLRPFARVLQPRLSSAGATADVTFVFDNGLVFTWGRLGAQFSLFGSPSGTRLIPAAADIARYLRGLVRMRTALRVTSQGGPDSLSASLESIRATMKSRFAFLFVYLPRPSAVPDLRRPAWVARISLGPPSKVLLDPQRILETADPLASLLEEAAAAAQTGRGAASLNP